MAKKDDIVLEGFTDEELQNELLRRSKSKITTAAAEVITAVDDLESALEEHKDTLDLDNVDGYSSFRLSLSGIKVLAEDKDREAKEA